ncbi:MAG: helix-turn-helix transcriptional regulator [Pleurocapsa sp.]
MEVITEAEFDTCWEENVEYQEIQSNTRGFDEFASFKTYWEQGSCYFTDKLTGIDYLDIRDKTIFHDSNCLTSHDDRPLCTSKFYLAGNHGVISPGINGVASEYKEQKGYSYFFYLPDIEEIEQYFQGDRIYKVKIEIELDSIRNLVTELDSISPQLQPLLEDKPPRVHYCVGKITPGMKTIIQQMIDHPYQGAIARMYLQGKVWELLAMQLSQLEGKNGQIEPVKLKPKEIKLIQDSRQILLQNIDNPPSIKILAQTVGMGDRKLQQGFKQLYGTTVFNYLQNYRLEQAQLMLREGNLSVATVANNIGYTHLGHFSAAFKRKFGITPRDCLKGKI